MKNLLIITILALFACTFAEQAKDEELYSRAVIESCPGCSLNRLPEIRKFIYEDVPKYNNVEFKKIHGAKPELVLYDNTDTEVSRIKLEQLTRKECNQLLASKGFQVKENNKIEL